MGQSALFEQILKMAAVQRVIDGRAQAGAHRGPFAVADRFEQQLAQRGMHREQRVEQMRKTDAPGLGHQTEERAIAVEAPRPAEPGDLQARLVVAVEQLAGERPARRLVGQLQRLGEDAAHGGIGLEIFKFHWRCYSFSKP